MHKRALFSDYFVKTTEKQKCTRLRTRFPLTKQQKEVTLVYAACLMGEDCHTLSTPRAVVCHTDSILQEIQGAFGIYCVMPILECCSIMNNENHLSQSHFFNAVLLFLKLCLFLWRYYDEKSKKSI